MDHYPEWEAKVMDKCYDTVDYLALHHYHIAKPGDILSLLGGAHYYEDFINTETAMLDYIQAKHRSPR
jgi:alpha-N-arabinofuranosidase